MKYKIKDLCKLISSGGTPSRKVKEYYHQGTINWIKTQELNDGNIYESEEKITELGLKNSSAKLFPINTVTMAMYGATVGKLGILMTESATNQACCNMVADPDKLDYKFLFYSLLYNRDEIISLANGAAQQNLNKKTIEEYEIDYFPLQEQKKIVSILSSLDEKIELNNRINKNLEEMAQSIFKSWFVDFEPFRDGEFVESELGIIPKGWKVSNFNCLVSNLIGGDWGKESPQGNYQSKVYCIRGADIPEVAKGSKGKIPVRFILEKNRQKKALQDGDIVIEISGGSPTQSTGRVALINKILLERFNSELICTNFCRVMKMKKRCYSVFVYLYMRYLYDKEVFFLFENGTTGIKNLDIKEFLEVYRIVVPPDEILEKFNREVEKLFSLIQQLGCENETLSTLRDTLLPKLMSGEIRVPLE